MTPQLAILCALFVLDAAFSGFREAAGRDPRVRKDAWFRRHILRGLVAGVGLAALLGALVLAFGLDVRSAGTAMLQVFVPYTVTVCLAMLLWFSRSLDLQVLASVLVLGPLTLVRPFAIVGGVAWGWWQSPTPAGAFVALLTIGAALGLGPVLRPPYQVGTGGE